MKVFINWSGTRSKAVAKALHDWLKNIFPNQVEPWMSDIDL